MLQTVDMLTCQLILIDLAVETTAYKKRDFVFSKVNDHD